ncbi:MAG: PorP/SprF family type IX secretion system membrane protein [Bacteroidia bacterium]
MKKLFPAFFLLFSLAAGAQELRNHFTVPGRIENNILFNFWQNPALTGYEERFNVQGGYGMRWLGLYSTSSYYKETNITSPQNWFAAFDVAMGKSKTSSLGFGYNHNRTLYEKRTEFLLSYSYTIKIKKSTQIRIGHSISYNQRGLDWSKLSFPDQVDSRYGFIYNTNEIFGRNGRGYPDFNHGLWFSRKHLFIGFSVLHSTEPDEGFFGVSKLPMQFYYNAGYHIPVSKEIIVTPSLIVMNKRNIWYFQPSLSVAFKNRYLLLLNYRNLNTLMIYAGAQVKENLRLSLGWGFPTSKELRAIQSGQSIEVMLRYRFKLRKDPTPEEQMNITKP